MINMKTIDKQPTQKTLKDLHTLYPCINNRNVLITGGASGIGESLVSHFFKQGANVIFLDNNKVASLFLISALTANTGENKGSVKFVECDVTDSEGLQTTIDEIITREGSIDILVNNVGDNSRQAFKRIKKKTWERCMSVNLESAFFSSQAVAPHMKKQKSGVIINLGSIVSQIGGEDMAGYITSKGAVLGLTTALAKELGNDNIRVNAIVPGWVATDKQITMWAHEESDWKSGLALNKRIMPDDVADLALFLASNNSKMITGQAFNLDCGKTLCA